MGNIMDIAPADLDILRRILESPTAPFHEQAVVDVVVEWASRQGLSARRDRWGNVLLDWPGQAGRRVKRASWCFAAHMDHPGFVLRRVDGPRGRSARRVVADFLGGVREEYLVAGGRVVFFDGGRVVKGVIKAMHMPTAGDGQRKAEVFPWAEIELMSPADTAWPVGAVGMWDFPAMRVRGDVLSSRACDDLVGCVAVLCAMRRVVEVRPAHCVTALLTRAEEVGFVGALAACEAGTVPAGSLVISVETSKAKAGASPGGGAVVRVGDATRTFDPAVTATVSATAAALAKEDETFAWSRQLMTGGTCEATAYQARGWRVGAVCLPLVNYHNMGPRGRLAPERVNLRDFNAVVKLLTALAGQEPDPSSSDRRLSRRFDEILANHRPRL